jgi:hypothetical protein
MILARCAIACARGARRSRALEATWRAGIPEYFPSRRNRTTVEKRPLKPLRRASDQGDANREGKSGERRVYRHEGADRRKYHRIETDQVISFAEIDRPDRLAVGKDMSTGGIRFEAVGCEIALGDVLRVTFNVMKQTVVAIGVVVWATDTDPISTDVGLEFLEIDPLALLLLHESANPELAGIEGAR